MSADLPNLPSLQSMGPARAAAFWLDRLQHEEAQEDHAVFTAWLKASEANQHAWDDALELWDSFEFVEEDEALGAMRQKALTFHPQRPRRRRLAYAVAGVIAMAALVSRLLK